MLAVDNVDGYFDTMGIVGLGPEREFDDESIVRELHRKGVIDEAKVGLNFEDPMSSDMVSTITFGHYDEGSVVKGRRGMNFYQNVGEDSWTLHMISPPTYNGVELYDSSVGLKLAHIDTASLNIVVPKAEFAKLLEAMREVDPTITTYYEEAWLGSIMKSSKSCEALAPLLSLLRINLAHASIIMKPKAYLYSFHGQNNCLIAIEQNEFDETDEYRLGTLFLRHLYLGLDFKHNEIVIGRNPAAFDIYFDGKALDPFNKAPKVITILVVLIVCGGAFGVYFYR